MKAQVDSYLRSKRNAWSPITLKNVRPMLLAYGEDILTLSPEAFFEKLKDMGAYSRRTLFVLATGFYGYCNPDKPNAYAIFRKENRNAFKNAYKRKNVGKTYEEIKALLEQQTDEAFRLKALSLLGSAQRWTESLTVSDGGGPNGTIVGKGGKQRPNFGKNKPDTAADDRDVSGITYATFRRRLKACCGITPHSLRKLALTRAASRGATAADLCAIAGWVSIATAFTYLQPQDVERLKSFLQ